MNPTPTHACEPYVETGWCAHLDWKLTPAPSVLEAWCESHDWAGIRWKPAPAWLNPGGYIGQEGR